MTGTGARQAPVRRARSASHCLCSCPLPLPAQTPRPRRPRSIQSRTRTRPARATARPARGLPTSLQTAHARPVVGRYGQRLYERVDACSARGNRHFDVPCGRRWCWCCGGMGVVRKARSTPPALVRRASWMMSKRECPLHARAFPLAHFGPADPQMRRGSAAARVRARADNFIRVLPWQGRHPCFPSSEQLVCLFSHPVNGHCLMGCRQAGEQCATREQAVPVQHHPQHGRQQQVCSQSSSAFGCGNPRGEGGAGAEGTQGSCGRGGGSRTAPPLSRLVFVPPSIGPGLRQGQAQGEELGTPRVRQRRWRRGRRVLEVKAPGCRRGAGGRGRGGQRSPP
jgi:hypothetical protein